MSKSILVVILFIVPTIGIAQEYRCQNGGKVYIAQYPCPGNEAKESAAPSPSRRSYDATSSVKQRTNATSTSSSEGLANSPIVRQSNAMIAAALAERDFAKAERLAVTKEQWQMIDAAKRQARKEWAEAESLAIQRNAQETAKQVAIEKRRQAEANAAAARANAAAAQANAAAAEANAAAAASASAASVNSGMPMMNGVPMRQCIAANPNDFNCVK